jgi:protein-S-isoprenylcysteine O-methyltransferase Ste14
MDPLIITYWIAIVAEMVVRAPLQKTWKAAPKAEQRISQTERTMLGLLFVGMFFVPLIYALTPWLDFANYRLPPWLGWLGVPLAALALFLFFRAHRDLKTFWSPSLEIFEQHSLITNGIYRYIRHPMYASQWVLSIAQILLLQNWIAGPITLLIFIPFYTLRVRAEEQMMLDRFGAEYRAYMQQTGAVFPKL